MAHESGQNQLLSRAGKVADAASEAAGATEAARAVKKEESGKDHTHSIPTGTPIALEAEAGKDLFLPTIADKKS